MFPVHLHVRLHHKRMLRADEGYHEGHPDMGVMVTGAQNQAGGGWGPHQGDDPGSVLQNLERLININVAISSLINKMKQS